MNKDNENFVISPLDGRYKEKVTDLAIVFSEFGLMKYRLEVEVRFFLALGKTNIFPRKINQKEITYLNSLFSDFSVADLDKVKSFEKVTNHDVKAIEYFLKDKMRGNSLKDLVEYVHLGRTSEDINNIAYAFILRQGIKIINSQYKKVESLLETLAKENKKTPMLALTHGQPASPTTFGWEMNVFKTRLNYGLKQLNSFKLKVKLNGATGGDNALYNAYPKINWRKFSNDFIKSLNNKGEIEFTNNPFTTQIESHDTYRELFDIMRGVNLVLIDFSRDMWSYISRGVIVQIPKAGEVGSSAMPQKVNPIDFENAEGNLDLANSLCEFFGRKLTISRLQRDLSDSTVERNFGLVFGHTKIALLSLEKGLSRVKVDKLAMDSELEKHWEVVSEAYQVVLRAHGILDGYELLKEYTRGKNVDKSSMHLFIDEISKKNNLPKTLIEKLKKITPQNYIGNRDF
ncbi:MAG: adenylosuccinate lyase [Candidatus Pacebacteria bacterium]|nr:adenylosuccinate lyase [Candidatus Paceibacterota bacterium]